MGNVVKEEDIYTTDCTTRAFFSKLDKAIDEMENGQVLSEDEVWKELDTI